jgi:glucose-1-phosphatase
VTIRSILLDFGNVVAFFDHLKACRQLAVISSVSITADEIYEAIFKTPLETDYDAGRISTAEFLTTLRHALRLHASDVEIARAWSDIYWPNEAMAAAILTLKVRGFRFVLASNTNELHHEWFGRQFADTLSMMDAQVVSYRVGSRKPERPFFDACLAAASCAASECLYVDDREDFVAAGRRLGMAGLVYTPAVDLVHLDMLFN